MTTQNAIAHSAVQTREQLVAVRMHAQHIVSSIDEMGRIHPDNSNLAKLGSIKSDAERVLYLIRGLAQ
jgi:hypothetical protein